MLLLMTVSVIHIQLTPTILICIVQALWIDIHDHVPHSGKRHPLQGLGEEVSHHLLSGTVLNFHFTAGNSVFHIEISNVDRERRPLDALPFSVRRIVVQFVVLIHNRLWLRNPAPPRSSASTEPVASRYSIQRALPPSSTWYWSSVWWMFHILPPYQASLTCRCDF